MRPTFEYRQTVNPIEDITLLRGQLAMMPAEDDSDDDVPTNQDGQGHSGGIDRHNIWTGKN
jgi:hypothetical protein